MGWIPIRDRDEYNERKRALENALQIYWEAVGTENPVWTKCIYACEQVTLKAYRLLMYVRKEYGGLNWCVDDRKIGEIGDAATDFYSITYVDKTSFQDESDNLEILSRAAYREMKSLKKARDDEMMEAWGNGM